LAQQKGEKVYSKGEKGGMRLQTHYQAVQSKGGKKRKNSQTRKSEFSLEAEPMADERGKKETSWRTGGGGEGDGKSSKN